MKQFFKRCIRGPLIVLLIVAASIVEAAPKLGSIGILDGLHQDASRMVVDDESIWYGPELKVHLPKGLAVVGVWALKVGSAVTFNPEFKDGHPYVSEIWVLETLPEGGYDEGIGDD